MRILLFLLAPLFFISGCAPNEEVKGTEEVQISDEIKEPYNGRPLQIGVIGEKPNKKFDNITFLSAEPVSLKGSLENEKYDEYFVTEQYFKELSKDDWTSIFTNIQTPVFFINLDVQAFIYRVDGMDYDNTSPKATEHTKGFVNIGDTIKSWGYGDPMESTKVQDTPEWIYNEIFRDVEKYLKDKRDTGSVSVPCPTNVSMGITSWVPLAKREFTTLWKIKKPNFSI